VAGWRVDVEIELRRSFPVIGDVGEQSGDEAKEGLRVWEDAGDAGTAFDLLAEAFCHVGGAQEEAVLLWQSKDGEAFRNVLLEPGGQFRSGFAAT
jgi:hypothetical protein